MKNLLVIVGMSLVCSPAFAKDCKEQAMAAAVQAEASREDAKGFNDPVNAKLVKDGAEQIWIATIKGNDGKNVDYSVKLQKKSCEILEEPERK